MEIKARIFGITISLLLVACANNHQEHYQTAQANVANHESAMPDCEQYLEQHPNKRLAIAYGLSPCKEASSPKANELMEAYGITPDWNKNSSNTSTAPIHGSSHINSQRMLMMGMEPKSVWTGGGSSEPMVEWQPRSSSQSISPLMLQSIGH